VNRALIFVSHLPRRPRPERPRCISSALVFLLQARRCALFSTLQGASHPWREAGSLVFRGDPYVITKLSGVAGPGSRHPRGDGLITPSRNDQRISRRREPRCSMSCCHDASPDLTRIRSVVELAVLRAFGKLRRSTGQVERIRQLAINLPNPAYRAFSLSALGRFELADIRFGSRTALGQEWTRSLQPRQHHVSIRAELISNVTA
jgi:hypothetical protein